MKGNPIGNISPSPAKQIGAARFRYQLGFFMKSLRTP
jgi:hypothetical protein